MEKPSGNGKRFCTECGKELNPDQRFCTGCGTPVAPVTEPQVHTPASESQVPIPTSPTPQAPAPVSEEPQAPVPASQVASEAAPAAQADEPAVAGSALKKNKTPIIAGIIIAAAVVVAAVIICATMMNKPDDTVAPDQAEHETAEEVPSYADYDDIDLPNELNTDYPLLMGVTYPLFVIDYPDGWVVTSHETDQADESFTIENDAKSVSVEFGYGLDSKHGLRHPKVANVEKVADSDFVPGYVQDQDYRDLGPFMVAKIELAQPKSDQSGSGSPHSYTECYAVVPESALEDSGVIEEADGGLGFYYNHVVSVMCMIPEGGFDAETDAEVIATLASFRLATDEETRAFARADSKADYLIPDSSSRLISSSELRGMSDYELFIARNEIYARHGRMFQKQELQDHFGSKSWYKPSIAPGDFTDSMLSDIERKNVETIKSIEESRNSQYLLS